MNRLGCFVYALALVALLPLANQAMKRRVSEDTQREKIWANCYKKNVMADCVEVAIGTGCFVNNGGFKNVGEVFASLPQKMIISRAYSCGVHGHKHDAGVVLQGNYVATDQLRIFFLQYLLQSHPNMRILPLLAPDRVDCEVVSHSLNVSPYVSKILPGYALDSRYGCETPVFFTYTMVPDLRLVRLQLATRAQKKSAYYDVVLSFFNGVNYE
jgi:hypothetical protein